MTYYLFNGSGRGLGGGRDVMLEAQFGCQEFFTPSCRGRAISIFCTFTCDLIKPFLPLKLNVQTCMQRLWCSQGCGVEEYGVIQAVGARARLSDLSVLQSFCCMSCCALCALNALLKKAQLPLLFHGIMKLTHHQCICPISNVGISLLETTWASYVRSIQKNRKTKYVPVLAKLSKERLVVPQGFETANFLLN